MPLTQGKNTRPFYKKTYYDKNYSDSVPLSGARNEYSEYKFASRVHENVINQLKEKAPDAKFAFKTRFVSLYGHIRRNDASSVAKQG